MVQSFRVTIATVVVSVLASAHALAQSPLRFSTEDGTTSVSLGVLLQPQVDWEGGPERDDVGSASLRRARLIAGGRLFEKVKFFVESDSPQLGVHSTGRTVDHEFFLQDLVLTYEIHRTLQVDGGLLMVPLAYNSNQSAASLLGVNYGPYSFVASAPTTSKFGRDWGTMLRGYLVGGHVEYRAGVFQGIREIDKTASPRVAGRVMWYPFDTHDGVFYPGTTLGKKHLLAVGAGLDTQESYRAFALDAFYDRPVGTGNAVTLQLDYIHYDGHETLATVRPQHAWLAEAGYYAARRRLGVFGQLARQDLVEAGGRDALSYMGGVAFWARGQRLVFKVGLGQTRKDGLPTSTNVTVQSQVFAF